MYRGIEFFTATCLNWQPLLLPDDRKDILMDSLNFVVNDKRIWLYGFVIMPNHINLMWRRQDAWLEKSTEQLFLKFTAQQIKFRLIESSPGRWSNTAARKATGYTISGRGGLTRPRCTTAKWRIKN
ncbi:MAG: hypothetical protein JSU09_03415 [Bacteroidetes bacterium]|nr:hypothetical protein [Bacteroidota bacterium]